VPVFIATLELDTDGETVLGVVTIPGQPIPIAVHTGHTVDEVRDEISEFLGEMFWDFDQEIHLKERIN
jgi:hypothetical protein